jgi:ferredoxin
MKYFKDEYIAHIKNKICPAKECKKLSSITIDKEKCKGCGICTKHCPVDAISGEIKFPYVIDPEICIKCGACISKCPFKAIS